MAVLVKDLGQGAPGDARHLCNFWAKMSQILTSNLFLFGVVLLGFVVTSVQSPQHRSKNMETAVENVLTLRRAPEFGGQTSPSSLRAGAAGPREPGKRLCHARPLKLSRKSHSRGGWEIQDFVQPMLSLPRSFRPLGEGDHLGRAGWGSRRHCQPGAAQSVRTPLPPLVNAPGGGRDGRATENRRLIGNDCSHCTITRGRKTNSHRPLARQGN